jgi:uncharacterized protein (TIGR03503 family)
MWLWLVVGCLFTPITLANEKNDDETQKIQLLSNRFRVDQAVNRIVFIIDRVPESAPIILVQPDGSKLYSSRLYNNVKWMDGNAGDMIEIANPQIGPWQIIGDILPSSEIRLATSLQLKVDPIPQELFVGEDIKLTSRLMFNNKLLQIGQVDDLIKHGVYLRSSDDPEAANFGAGTFLIGDFIDNGFGLDAKSGDGIFTGRLDLNKQIGNYELAVRVSNKVFEREYKQPLLLRARPVAVDLLTAAIGEQYRLRFITNDKIADIEKILLQIKVTHPDDTVKHHSINGVVPTHLFRLSDVKQPGKYKIDIDVFGQTVAGRDFEFKFKPLKVKLTALPVAVAEKAQKQFDSDRETAFEKKLKRKEIAEARQQDDDKKSLIIIAIMVNVFILLFGAILMWLFLRVKKNKATKDDQIGANQATKKTN